MTSNKSLVWIGDFPASWEVMPNKALIRKKKISVGSNADEYSLLSLTKGGVVVRNVDEGGKFPENFDSYQRVSSGDLVTCLFDVAETPRTIGLSNHNGMITGAYDVFEFTNRVNPRYFEYYYLALDDRKGLSYFYSGLRNVIRTPVFLSIPMPVPPLDKQKAIVDFLDRELAQIELLTEKFKQLIELANSAFMQKVKSSVLGMYFDEKRVETPYGSWAPSIPTSWSYASLRRVCSVFSGGTPDRNNLGYWTEGSNPWINSGAVNQVIISEPSELITDAAVRESSTRLAPKGSIVMALAGQGATKGTPALMGIDAYCNQSMVVIVPDERVSADFLYFWLLANYSNIRNMGGGDLRDGLNQEHVKSIKMPLPPIKVQISVSQNLWDAYRENTKLLESLEQALGLLVERKQALISAAVTGKIDIAKAA